MARQRQIRFTREGISYTIVLVAVLVGANARQLNLLMLLGSMLAGPLLFSLFYGRLSLRRIVIERKPTPLLRADERLIVDVSVTNLRRWLGIWTIEVQDVVRREKTAGDPGQAVNVGVFYPRIAARETRQASYQGSLPQRGKYRFGPLRVSTRFPLGLVRHTLLLDQKQELLVHPRLGRLTHDWSRVVQENERGSQRMERRGLLEADFYGLRDWRTGDSRRWIHWRTSARRGSLVVRQFEQRRSQDLALLVDLWQDREPDEAELENVETAVSFAATIIAEACHHVGRKLFVTLCGEAALHRSGPASPYFFREQMDALALVKPHHEAEFPAALGHALALIPASTPTLLVSTRTIDWDAFQAAASERNVLLDLRQVQCINVGNRDQLARYFHP